MSVFLGSLYIVIYGLMLAAFLQSLRPGRTPIITRLALVIRGDLPPAIIDYTRQVTIAWVSFFVSLLLVSLLLFFFAPRGWWLTFVGVLNLPLLLLMFAAEYGFRRWRFPHFRHDNWQEMRQIPARLRSLILSAK